MAWSLRRWLAVCTLAVLQPACDSEPERDTTACVACLTAGGGATANCGAADGARARALVAEGAHLLDVRTTTEYAAGHLPGALNLPLAELPSRLGELDATVPVVVYCRSGRRSAEAAVLLCAAGFVVHDLGPMAAWGT